MLIHPAQREAVPAPGGGTASAAISNSNMLIHPARGAGLAYAVFISSALCYGLITYANKNLPATVVAAFWPLQVTS